MMSRFCRGVKVYIDRSDFLAVFFTNGFDRNTQPSEDMPRYGALSAYLLLNDPGITIRSVRVRPFSIILDRV